jgi:hypothetical protein
LAEERGWLLHATLLTAWALSCLPELGGTSWALFGEQPWGRAPGLTPILGGDLQSLLSLCPVLLLLHLPGIAWVCA